jgi:hypothetical protein
MKENPPPPSVHYVCKDKLSLFPPFNLFLTFSCPPLLSPTTEPLLRGHSVPDFWEEIPKKVKILIRSRLVSLIIPFQFCNIIEEKKLNLPKFRSWIILLSAWTNQVLHSDFAHPKAFKLSAPFVFRSLDREKFQHGFWHFWFPFLHRVLALFTTAFGTFGFPFLDNEIWPWTLALLVFRS